MSWFNQVFIGHLSDDGFYQDVAAFDNALAAYPFVPCDSITPKTMGWVPPESTDQNEALVKVANHCYWFTLRIQERIVPTVVLRQAVESRIAKLKAQGETSITKAQQQQIKEQVHHELLKQAFVKNRDIEVMIDTKQQRLCINTTVVSQIEQVTGLLRQCFGRLKLTPLVFDGLALMWKDWLLQQAYVDDAIEIGHTCVLEDPNNDSVIRCRNQDLFANEIQALLQEGKQVSQLSFTWRDCVDVALTSDFAIKQFKSRQSAAEQKEQSFEEASVLFSQHLTSFIDDIKHMVERWSKRAD